MPLPFRRPRARLALLLLWGATTAQAQSLLQLYQTAHGYDATYRSALANAQASQARADQARAGLLPQLGMQAGAQHNWADTHVLGGGSSRSFNTLNAALVGSQPLYRPANRIDLTVAARDLNRGMFDLARANMALAAGGTYRARAGEREIVFRVSANARPGAVPVVSRLIRF